MERGKAENEPTFGLEQAAEQLPRDYMLQFTPHSYRLLELVEAGETEEVVISEDGVEYSFNATTLKTVLKKEAPSLGRLFRPVRRAKVEVNDGGHGRWAESLLTPEDIRKAAAEELERRKADGDRVDAICIQCKGEKSCRTACFCVQGGAPDTKCESCAGTGVEYDDCLNCGGHGRVARYPQIIIGNKLNGDLTVIKLDLAQLIADGEVSAKWKYYGSTRPDGKNRGTAALRLDIAAYIHKRMAEIGIDNQSYARVREYGDVEKIDLRPGDIVLRTAHLRGFGEDLVPELGGMEMPAAGILRGAQVNLANAFARTDIEADEGPDSGIPEMWAMRPLRSAQETTEDLVELLWKYGLTLGLMNDLGDNGKPVYFYFLLDDEGEPRHMLSSGTDLREALENSWLDVQELMGEAFGE